MSSTLWIYGDEAGEMPLEEGKGVFVAAVVGFLDHEANREEGHRPLGLSDRYPHPRGGDPEPGRRPEGQDPE
jgi:hypothetical protein